MSAQARAYCRLPCQWSPDRCMSGWIKLAGVAWCPCLALDEVVVVDAGGGGIAGLARRDVQADRRSAAGDLLLERNDGVLATCGEDCHYLTFDAVAFGRSSTPVAVE